MRGETAVPSEDEIALVLARLVRKAIDRRLSPPSEMGAPAASPARPAFRDVFESNLDHVWRTLRHLGVPACDVEDVAQEVFVVVHRRLPEWEPRHPIRTWLYTICRSAARDRARRAHVREERATAEVPERSESATPHEDLEAVRALEQVHAALEGVDPAQREVFLMYELEGIAMDHIAETIGCPVKTAYSRLRLARAHVHRALGAPESEAGDG
jgi:RNA polymerase sigma-70 factor (ECF subfamily)